jgi:hypothetical protein
VDGECVNRVAIEIRMDDHGRMRTSLTRTGNAVSGVTRIEGSNPSRSAKNPCTVRLLGTRELRLRDAIGQITAPDLTPTMTPSQCSANVGGRPWTGYRISAQSAALGDQPDECGHVVPPECSQTAPAALDPCVFEANGSHPTATTRVGDARPEWPDIPSSMRDCDPQCRDARTSFITRWVTPWAGVAR